MRAAQYPKLRWPTKHEYSDIIIWSLLTLALGLLPLWGGGFARIIFDKHLELGDFVVHGEFAFYTASLVSGTMYIVCRDIGTAFPFRAYFILVLVLLALWCSLITGGVFIIDANPLSASKLAWSTIPAFFLVMVVSILAMLFERVITLPNPHEVDEAQVEELAKKVRTRRAKTPPTGAKGNNDTGVSDADQ